MKRQKPDPLRFALWAARNLEFRIGESQCSRGAYMHFRDQAEREGFRPGSPAAFRNAMSKIGCPHKPVREGSCHRRRHQDVTLAHHVFGPPVPLDDADGDLAQNLALEVLVHRIRRYGSGKEVRRAPRRSNLE